MRSGARLSAGRTWALALVLGAGSLAAVQPKDSPSSLESKEMFVPELHISNQNLALDQALAETRDRAALKVLAARQAGAEATGREVKVWIDPRGGAAVNVLGSFPLIPGDGVGNRITLEQVGAALGRGVSRVDGKVVGDLVRRFAEGHRALLGIDTAQLGEARTGDPNPDLWHVSIPQVYQGIPVRYGRLLATLSHGNMVLLGAENWADVQGLAATPSIPAEKALDLGFEYAGGRSGLDDLVAAPQLEIVPYAPLELQSGEGYGGPIGQGLRHYLAWVYTYQRRGEDPVYKVTVDAHSGRVLEFKDTNEYVNRQIKGGAYPLTNTEICPNNQQCGTMQLGVPMPFADTGLAAPDNYTNSGGLFNYTSGSVTTTLNGKYVRIADTCGSISESTATPPLDLGGSNGQHDCTSAGSSAGDTSASRSGFYELNKLIEMARGYLPTNTWLQGQLTSNMNLNQTCNAFWNGSTVNFYRSGGGCRNTGEIAAVFDHEWGHGMDDNDTAGALSSSSEAYADIASIYRLQASCVGHGFFWTSNPGCGPTSDGTGFNANEALTGAAHCDLDCSGVRDTDWDKHADHTPDTPLGFVCTSCTSGSGPCGRQVHCSAAPVRQAAWDFVKRDLQGAPFNLNDQTAFLVANKVFYQGSGNVGAWHSCTCGGTADGCAAANGYMQWLAADDDNGNISDGTPHMTALHAAYNRHGIACATPTPANSGCASGPTGAPTLTVTPGLFQNALSWTAVAGATRYWVYRSEGYAGCDFGKALIAEVTAPTTVYTDTAVANGRPYSYNVVAAGAASACFGPASSCGTGTPQAGADFAVSCSPSTLNTWEGEGVATTCTVSSSDGFNASVALSCQGLPAGLSCGFSPGSVTPPANSSANSTLTLTLGPGVLRGSYSFQVKGTNAGNDRFASVQLDVNGYGTDRHGRYDSGLKVPRCFNVGRACDTGALVNGRDGISGGAEPNQPNTINNSCADGTSGTYHVDESIDYVRIYTTNGQPFAGGSPVQIDVKAWITDFTQDKVDVYYAPDANTPAWALVGTLTPTANGLQTLGTTYTLTGSNATPSALRAHLRRGGAAASCGAGPFDDHDDLVFALGLGDQTATYDATLKAPKCGVVGKSCDSGPTLLVGRGTMSPAEANQPNTINTSCADGGSGSFHSDESNDRLKIYTNDGTALAPGKSVTIEATVWAYSSFTSDWLEIYHAPDAAAPVWTAVGSSVNPPAAGQQVMSRTFTLPAGGPLQAIRAKFRFSSSAGACVAGNYNDHDDLIFAVAP